MKKSRRRSSKPSQRSRPSKAGRPKTYPGKLPRHVKKFTTTVKGKKRTAYFSKITNRRISASVIRRNRADQAIAERFPNASKKGIRNIKRAVMGYKKNFGDMGAAERGVFEDRYKSLFKYLRTHAPDQLPEYERLNEERGDDDDEDDGDE